MPGRSCRRPTTALTRRRALAPGVSAFAVLAALAALADDAVFHTSNESQGVVALGDRPPETE